MKMGSKICMNQACRAATTSEWKKGWGLRSGGYATLCNNCGSAYENLMFCYTFHQDDSGWRQCTFCRKNIHCGCIASKSLHEYMDFGGICCTTCVKFVEPQTIRPTQLYDERIGSGTANGHGKVIIQLPKVMEEKETLHQSDKDVEGATPKQCIQEQTVTPVAEVCPSVPKVNKQVAGSSSLTRLDLKNRKDGVQTMHESMAQPMLKFSLSTQVDDSISTNCFPNASEGLEPNKSCLSQQAQILPKPLKPSRNSNSESMKAPPTPKARVARPPANGRGHHQLLPRYWPRITDHELQQICGHLNATIVPLFEKILSASDAGRIGRLVLPKACAEAYFPHINNSDGIPIRVQDITGKEWTFQFRFWPNNNSRMYVLEGVTPCIQNMQLEAGDTVTFSRIEPGGKLVIGARKATNNDAQEIQMNSLSNGASSSEEVTLNCGNDNLPANGGRTSKDNIERMITEKKTMRNIGSKNKRLRIHNEDAVELQITWEEAQDLLRPCPTARPNIISIEDLEIEEYDDPPVLGKKSIISARPSGEEEQWVQCDSCSKWRRLPVDVLIPAKWSCSDNIWDSTRSSCSVPEDINVQLDVLQSANQVSDIKRCKIISKNEVSVDCEPSGLDALATAAVLGYNTNELGEISPGATTKHPRHRPGCSCIVCIQPPSGKGKHPATCKCNACLTVRRRHKTLMQRKKKRQSERETDLAYEKDQEYTQNVLETDASVGEALLQMNHPENDITPDDNQMDAAETKASNTNLDLNSHPTREDEMLAAASAMSLTNLVTSTSLPLDMHLKQPGLGSFSTRLPPQVSGTNGHVFDTTPSNMEGEKKGEEA